MNAHFRPAFDRRVAIGVVAAHGVLVALAVVATAKVPAGASADASETPPAVFSVTVSLPSLRDAPPPARAPAAPARPSREDRPAPPARHAEPPVARSETTASRALAPAPEAAPATADVAVAASAGTAPAANSTAVNTAATTIAATPGRAADVAVAPAVTPAPDLVAARPDHDRCPSAGYPVALKERGIEGTVWLRVQVSQDGQPAEVAILRGSGWRLFDEAALQAARGCRFIPARRGDERLASWVEFPMRFALSS